MSIAKNNKYEILTPYGWCDFDGTQKKGVDDLYIIQSGNNVVTATKDHTFYVKGEKKNVFELKEGIDTIDGCENTISNISLDRTDEVYDILNVNNEKNSFIVNGCFHSKNCLDEFAFLPKHVSSAFWAANYPTISASLDAKIVIISCVTGDTYVYSNKGIRQVSDFIKKDRTGGYIVDQYNVLGKDKINTGMLMVNNGEVDTKIISTTTSQIEGSLNHKLFACKDGTYGWYKLSELSVGDYVSIQYGMNLWGNDDYIGYTSTDYNVKYKGKNITKKYQENKKIILDNITPDWAYLFGLYISEGYAGKNRVTITCGDNVSSVFEKLNIKYYCTDDLHYQIGSTSIVNLLKHVGFDITKKAKSKEIPEKLMSMSKENTCAMLSGIFDGDGFSRNDRGTIGINLSSKKLLLQIKMLLLNIGCLSNYFEGVSRPTERVKVSSNHYRLELDNTSSKVFYDNIGFRFYRKQANESKLRPCFEEKVDIIPYGHFHIKPYRKYVREEHKIYRNDKQHHLSRRNMLDIKRILFNKNIELDEKMSFIFDNCVSENIKWEKIKKITESKNIVYDFSLNNIKNDNWCHSVIYNGYIGHQTPNGMYGQFYTIYTEAERGENSFVPFKSSWKDVPGRDDAWAKTQERNLGKQKFAQEYNVNFLGSTSTVVSPATLEFLFSQYKKDPLLLDMKGKFRVYETPLKDCNYVLGVDSSKGTGGDYSVVQVLKIISRKPIQYEQVSVYESNSTDIYLFTDIVHRISLYYNGAYIMVENNAEGSTVVNKLWWDIETDKLVNSGVKQVDLGIRATKNTKPRAVLLMKKLIEDHCLKINDKQTVEQLASFIEDKGRFYGKDLHDDLVSALYWAVYITELNIFEDGSKLKSSIEMEKENDEEDVWGVLSDVNEEANHEDDFSSWGSIFG
jgi:hypothetical protein